MKKALILGAGFSGCTMAYVLKKEGWDCTIIEKEDFIGGGCRTFFYGGHPYTKGPRPYYGYSEKIFSWVNSFVPMRRFPHYLLSYIEQEGRFYHYPIHDDDIPMMKERDRIYRELKERNMNERPKNFEEYWINRVGPTLYDMFVNQYSKKMWLINSNTEMDTFNWSAKDKPIQTGSKGCYIDSVFGYPNSVDGYNPYFEKTTRDVKVILNENVADIDLNKKTIKLSSGSVLSGDIIISSIPIEELCSYSLGALPYAGRDFIVFVLPCKQVLPGDVRFCHYPQNEPYTRIVEYKKLTFHESEDTLLVMEIPSKNNKLYPYMIREYLDKAQNYVGSLPEDVFSVGRLGTYKYTSIEQTLAQCFSLFRRITGKVIDGIENEFYHIGDTGLIGTRKE